MADDHDRSVLRQMLDSIKFWRRHNWRMSINGRDETDSWIGDQLSRARNLWRVISARESRNA